MTSHPQSRGEAGATSKQNYFSKKMQWEKIYCTAKVHIFFLCINLSPDKQNYFFRKYVMREKCIVIRQRFTYFYFNVNVNLSPPRQTKLFLSSKIVMRKNILLLQRFMYILSLSYINLSLVIQKGCCSRANLMRNHEL